MPKKERISALQWIAWIIGAVALALLIFAIIRALM